MASINFTNSYSTAGLDIRGINHIKEAVKKYISDIEKVSDELDTTKNAEWEAKIEKGFKGTNSEAVVKGYITNVCKKCRNEINSLTSFVNALDKLEEAYKNNDSNVSFTMSSGNVDVE